MQTIHTVISNIPYPTDLHTIPSIHTIPTIHAIHTIPTIHTKHTIHSKHAIYSIYCHTYTTPPHQTPRTRGKGTVLWLTHDHGRGGGGLERWTIYTYNTYIYIYIIIYPPTPAFAKAGAAPGTTVGVELLQGSVAASTTNSGHSPLRPGTQATALCC